MVYTTETIDARLARMAIGQTMEIWHLDVRCYVRLDENGYRVTNTEITADNIEYITPYTLPGILEFFGLGLSFEATCQLISTMEFGGMSRLLVNGKGYRLSRSLEGQYRLTLLSPDSRDTQTGISSYDRLDVIACVQDLMSYGTERDEILAGNNTMFNAQGNFAIGPDYSPFHATRYTKGARKEFHDQIFSKEGFLHEDVHTMLTPNFLSNFDSCSDIVKCYHAQEFASVTLGNHAIPNYSTLEYWKHGDVPSYRKEDGE